MAAWRYREIEIEDGDVLDPRDWNENVEPYANEINGFLDRDNLNEEQIAHGAEISWNRDTGPLYAVEYVKVPDPLGTNPHASTTQSTTMAPWQVSYWHQFLEEDTQAWQQVENVAISIPTTSDELFIIEAGFQLQHDIYKQVSGDYNRLNDPLSYFHDHLSVRAMLTVDGFQVAEAGPIAGCFTKIGVPLMGAFPVSAGSHDVKLYVKLERQTSGDDDKWRDASELFIAERNMMILRRMR